MPPPHCPMPQPEGRQGSSFVALAECAAGTLNAFVRRALPHDGQTGFSSPRIKTSKSFPQSLQLYS
jgi:hypothetical protein